MKFLYALTLSAVIFSGHASAHSRDGRPSAWCGWYMRQVKGVADSAYNLAANWAHWGHNAGGPRIGAVVVWRHHVGEITGRKNGRWIVHSGNYGNRVATVPMSLRGAIAFRI